MISATATKRLQTLGVVLLVGWAVTVWGLLRPPDIVSDWNGGRQVDTQTIAMNLARDGASLFWPQVSWGGDGPGYVETELQLYTKIISVFIRAFGAAPWSGQLVSLLSITGTAMALWGHLGRRFGVVGALAGVVSFLGQRTATHLASVVMPDALALFAYTTAWAAFHRYATDKRLRDLVLFAVIGAVGMMQKPTTAQIGVSSFLLLALMGGGRLKDYKVWAAWGVMVALFGAYLAHAHHIYEEYGNTFGVLFGQDGKAPHHLRNVLMPQVLWGAVQNFVRWGYGHVGVLAILAVVVLRRVEAEHVALAVGNVVITFIALRYMSQDSGNYYFAPANVLASSAVASLTTAAVQALRGERRRAALGALGLVMSVQLVRNLQVRHMYAHFDDQRIAALVTTGKELGRLAHPGDLVVVRSQHLSYDEIWDWPTKQCEPRVLFVSQTRGWVMGREDGPGLLTEARAKGARFYADPVEERNVAVEDVLSTMADLVWSVPGVGRIWRLRPPQARQ